MVALSEPGGPLGPWRPPLLAPWGWEAYVGPTLWTLGLAFGLWGVGVLGEALLAQAFQALEAEDSAQGLKRRLARWRHLEGWDPRPSLRHLLAWLGWAARLGLGAAWLIASLQQWPATQGLAAKLMAGIQLGLLGVGEALLAFVPNAITILVAIVGARLASRLTDFTFQRMRLRPVELGFGLPPELIEAFHRLAKVLVWVFAAMIAAPMLPGLGTQAGQAIALLVGAMLTLGSGTTIGNAVAGFVLVYMRPFRAGDWVSLGGLEGEVVQVDFLTVRLRPPQGELVCLTSSQVLAAPMINHSEGARSPGGLWLEIEVGIGYDTPRAQVEALLVEAAMGRGFVAGEPKPEVWVVELPDHCVSYRLRAATHVPKDRPRLQSALRQAALDAFRRAGVEILSPLHHAVRASKRSVPLPEPSQAELP